MRHTNSLSLFTYWNAKRGKRPAPARSDIEPSDIRTLLPHVFICEIAASDRLTFRLAGTAICLLKGKELKASHFSELWFRDGQRNMERTARAVVDDAKPAVLSVDALSCGGRMLAAELLLLPVSGPSGGNDRLIGSLSVIESPYWIGHDPVAGFSTTGIRFLDPERESVFLSNRPEVPLPPAVRQNPSEPLFGRRKGAHLFVVEGGRSD
ncbi:PAS domain-containing protein [Hoeflea marina]|uniref:PAS domain-containing protein n=1 Tax=Hoeflea marina TaxID=274592 RepID=UPI001304CA6D|nr:PAS domain-containing protein [Hoeflea marina]